MPRNKRTPKTAKRRSPQATKRTPKTHETHIVELDEALRVLRTSRSTLYRWIREGRIRAMKAGAFDYLEKPFGHQELLDRAFETRKLGPNLGYQSWYVKLSSFLWAHRRSIPSSSSLGRACSTKAYVTPLP